MQILPRTALLDSRTSELEQVPKAFYKLTLVVAGLLAAFYFATSIYIASHRLYWFDEFFTIRIA